MSLILKWFYCMNIIFAKRKRYRDEKDYKNAKKYYKMAMDKGSREAETEYNTILIMEEHGL